MPSIRSPFESLVLTHRPSNEIEVDASEEQVQSGFVEASIIIDPTCNDRIVTLGQFRYRLPRLQMKSKPPKFFAQSFDRLVRSRRQKAVELLIGLVTGISWGKGESQKIKANLFELPLAVGVLAVDELGLYWMKFQFDLCKPLL